MTLGLSLKAGDLRAIRDVHDHRLWRASGRRIILGYGVNALFVCAHEHGAPSVANRRAMAALGCAAGAGDETAVLFSKSSHECQCARASLNGRYSPVGFGDGNERFRSGRGACDKPNSAVSRPGLPPA